MPNAATSLLNAALGGKTNQATTPHSKKTPITAAHSTGTSLQPKPTSVKSLKKELPAVGERIRQAREQAGLTQQELGKTLGLSNKTVSALELAHVEPSTTQILALSRTFGKPVGYFVGEELSSMHETLSAIEQQLSILRGTLKQ